MGAGDMGNRLGQSLYEFALTSGFSLGEDGEAGLRQLVDIFDEADGQRDDQIDLDRIDYNHLQELLQLHGLNPELRSLASLGLFDSRIFQEQQENNARLQEQLAFLNNIIRFVCAGLLLIKEENSDDHFLGTLQSSLFLAGAAIMMANQGAENQATQTNIFSAETLAFVGFLALEEASVAQLTAQAVASTEAVAAETLIEVVATESIAAELAAAEVVNPQVVATKALVAESVGLGGSLALLVGALGITASLVTDQDTMLRHQARMLLDDGRRGLIFDVPDFTLSETPDIYLPLGGRFVFGDHRLSFATRVFLDQPYAARREDNSGFDFLNANLSCLPIEQIEAFDQTLLSLNLSVTNHQKALFYIIFGPGAEYDGMRFPPELFQALQSEDPHALTDLFADLDFSRDLHFPLDPNPASTPDTENPNGPQDENENDFGIPPPAEFPETETNVPEESPANPNNPDSEEIPGGSSFRPFEDLYSENQPQQNEDNEGSEPFEQTPELFADLRFGGNPFEVPPAVIQGESDEDFEEYGPRANPDSLWSDDPGFGFPAPMLASEGDDSEGPTDKSDEGLSEEPLGEIGEETEGEFFDDEQTVFNVNDLIRQIDEDLQAGFQQLPNGGRLGLINTNNEEILVQNHGDQPLAVHFTDSDGRSQTTIINKNGFVKVSAGDFSVEELELTGRLARITAAVNAKLAQGSAGVLAPGEIIRDYIAQNTLIKQNTSPDLSAAQSIHEISHDYAARVDRGNFTESDLNRAIEGLSALFEVDEERREELIQNKIEPLLIDLIVSIRFGLYKNPAIILAEPSAEELDELDDPSQSDTAGAPDSDTSLTDHSPSVPWITAMIFNQEIPDISAEPSAEELDELDDSSQSDTAGAPDWATAFTLAQEAYDIPNNDSLAGPPLIRTDALAPNLSPEALNVDQEDLPNLIALQLNQERLTPASMTAEIQDLLAFIRELDGEDLTQVTNCLRDLDLAILVAYQRMGPPDFLAQETNGDFWETWKLVCQKIARRYLGTFPEALFNPQGSHFLARYFRLVSEFCRGNTSELRQSFWQGLASQPYHPSVSITNLGWHQLNEAERAAIEAIEDLPEDVLPVKVISENGRTALLVFILSTDYRSATLTNLSDETIHLEFYGIGGDSSISPGYVTGTQVLEPGSEFTYPNYHEGRRVVSFEATIIAAEEESMQINSPDNLADFTDGALAAGRAEPTSEYQEFQENVIRLAFEVLDERLADVTDIADSSTFFAPETEAPDFAEILINAIRNSGIDSGEVTNLLANIKVELEQIYTNLQAYLFVRLGGNPTEIEQHVYDMFGDSTDTPDAQELVEDNLTDALAVIARSLCENYQLDPVYVAEIIDALIRSLIQQIKPNLEDMDADLAQYRRYFDEQIALVRVRFGVAPAQTGGYEN